MTNANDNAGSTLPQTKTLTTDQQTKIEKFSKLEDRLHNMLSCYRFQGEAILALMESERFDDSKDWYFGWFLHNQWLKQQGDQLMAELLVVKQSLSS